MQENNNDYFRIFSEYFFRILRRFSSAKFYVWELSKPAPIFIKISIRLLDAVYRNSL